MIICERCKKEMTCALNGVHAIFGESHCYMSDRYVCACGNSVLSTNRESFYLPTEKQVDIRPEKIVRMGE